MSEVEYAGPTANAPNPKEDAPKAKGDDDAGEEPKEEKPAPKKPKKVRGDMGATRPSTVADTNEVSVHFNSTPDGVTFHLRTSTGTATTGGYYSSHSGWNNSGFYSATTTMKGFTPICTAPCDAMLPRGTQILAMSKGKGKPIEVDDEVVLSGPSTIDGRYKSNDSFRSTGIAIGAGIGVAGAAMGMWGLHKKNSTLGYGGLAVVGASLLVALVFAYESDDVSIRVVPTSTWSSSGSKERTVSAGEQFLPTGAMVTGVF